MRLTEKTPIEVSRREIASYLQTRVGISDSTLATGYPLCTEDTTGDIGDVIACRVIQLILSGHFDAIIIREIGYDDDTLCDN